MRDTNLSTAMVTVNDRTQKNVSETASIAIDKDHRDKRVLYQKVYGMHLLKNVDMNVVVMGSLPKL
jgi:hypothetical protein